MKALRIKLDENAKPNEKGYYTVYENQNKNGNRNAPDFKAKGIGVWNAEFESVGAAEQAVQAGAAAPQVQQTVQA